MLSVPWLDIIPDFISRKRVKKPVHSYFNLLPFSLGVEITFFLFKKKRLWRGIVGTHIMINDPLPDGIWQFQKSESWKPWVIFCARPHSPFNNHGFNTIQFCFAQKRQFQLFQNTVLKWKQFLMLHHLSYYRINNLNCQHSFNILNPDI